MVLCLWSCSEPEVIADSQNVPDKPLFDSKQVHLLIRACITGVAPLPGVHSDASPSAPASDPPCHPCPQGCTHLPAQNRGFMTHICQSLYSLFLHEPLSGSLHPQTHSMAAGFGDTASHLLPMHQACSVAILRRQIHVHSAAFHPWAAELRCWSSLTV